MGSRFEDIQQLIQHKEAARNKIVEQERSLDCLRRDKDNLQR